MIATLNMAQIAALIGDPTRATILNALMDGRALPATDLALIAGVTPQTASSHLAKLVDGALLESLRSGRHRYYRLADPKVAELLESLMVLAPGEPAKRRAPNKKLARLRDARSCYDHLAGRLGVAVTESLLQRGVLTPATEDFEVTTKGEAFFHDLDIDLEALRKTRRVFARQCIDWSERRPHLGGVLGAAFAETCFKSAWVKRGKLDRSLAVTTKGRAAFQDLLALDWQS